MMTQSKTEQKLQAYLDGELSEAQARAVERWLKDHPEAQATLEELRWTRDVLQDNEPEVTLPETREFFWSKIEREINSLDAGASHRPQPTFTSWFSLRKWLAPCSGLALVAILVVAIVQFFDINTNFGSSKYLARIESPSEEMGAFSFRSQSENVFVIWLYERSTDLQPQMSYVDDLVIQ